MNPEAGLRDTLAKIAEGASDQSHRRTNAVGTSMTQKDDVYFADRDYSLLLYPPKSYPDGICYDLYVDLVAGPLHGTIDANSFVKVQALDRFRDELVARSMIGLAAVS